MYMKRAPCSEDTCLKDLNSFLFSRFQSSPDADLALGKKEVPNLRRLSQALRVEFILHGASPARRTLSGTSVTLTATLAIVGHSAAASASRAGSNRGDEASGGVRVAREGRVVALRSGGEGRGESGARGCDDGDLGRDAGDGGDG